MADLPNLEIDKGLNIYGGISEPKYQASGFFRTEKINNRWWLIDPAGGRYIHRGLAAVNTIATPGAVAALQATFKDKKGWGDATTKLIADIGFNGFNVTFNTAESNSDYEAMIQAPLKMSSTRILSLMSRYGKKRGGITSQPGHAGYPGDCPFIFDQEFETYCKQTCKVLAKDKDNPWILGYYTDNELPWQRDLLDKYLKLDEKDQGRIFTEAWVKKNKVNKDKITDSDRDAFLEVAAETYFRITSQAIRENDPNHLILGSRFHGLALRLNPLFRAAGKYCDIISINYYSAWVPNKVLMETWVKDAKKPFIITEWYAKAEDTGMNNESGAGWLVRTQKDRGYFYQHFALGLIENPGCVGWYWFRYNDNDVDEKVDASNRDSNKGVVNNRYVPYAPLVDAMRELNSRNYGLVDYYDKKNNR
jgi:hypothetical protein